MTTITNQLSAGMITYILRSLSQKKIPYITLPQVKEDIANNRLYAVVKNGIPVCACSVVWSDEYQNYGLKRLVCFKKKNSNHGFAKQLIEYVTGSFSPVSCTPWTDNSSMRHLLEQQGFYLDKIFNQYWCLYLKGA